MDVLRINFLANILPVLFVVLAVFVLIRSQRQELWHEAFRRLRKSRIGWMAACLVALFGFIAFLDSVTWQPSIGAEPKSVVEMMFKRNAERTYSAPFAKVTSGEAKEHALQGTHVLGTDGVGEDTLYLAIRGIRTAVIIGGFSCLIAVPLALLLGLSAGFYGKAVDDSVQYTYTVFGSIPDILLIISLVLMLGKGLTSICVALGLTSWTSLCRLIRGETLKHRDREYVRAAKALGVGNGRILIKHILPNLLPAVIISVTLLFSNLVLYESILSYLNIGVGPDTGSWGNMINASRNELTRVPPVWWNLAISTSFLLVFVLSLNLLADALRDAIDPRLRTE